MVTRDVRWLSDVAADLRYGVRTLRRSPGFTTVAMLMLALGIGANTAIFSVVDALLLRPLPVPQSEQLVQAFLLRPDQRPVSAFAYPFVRALAERREIFEGLFGFTATTLSVGRPGEVEQVDGAWVTGEYYATLRLSPALGRLLTPDDDRPGAEAVAVITDGYWKRRFGGDRAMLGESILIYGAPVTIVGVTAPGFAGTTVGRVANITLALGAAPRIRPELSTMLGIGANTLSIMARPRSGLSGDVLASQLGAAWPGVVERAMPDAGESRRNYLSARPVIAAAGTGWSGLRQQFATPLIMLMALVGVVMLIVCSNVANLLLARTAARSREIATRLALGATRGRVTRQLLTESVLLALAGSALGLLAAWFGSQSLGALLTSGGASALGPTPGPAADAAAFILDVTPGPSVLMFTLLVTIITVLVFGTAPALAATRRAENIGHGAGAIVTRRGRTGQVLVIAQLALTVVLLMGAGLFVRTLENLRSLDRGFEAEGVLLVDVDARVAGISGPAVAAVYRDLQQEIERLPSVRLASYSGRAPLAPGETSYPFLVNGLKTKGESLLHTVGSGYFATLRTPVLRGREFTPADTAAAPRVAVVNEAFARQFLSGLDPIGQRLGIGGNAESPMDVVGIVKDTLLTNNVRYQSAPPSVYVPYAQRPPARATFEIAVTTRSVPEVAAALERTMAPRLPNARIEVRTLSEQLDRALFQERIVATVGGTFAVVALLLASIGLYGLLAYTVTRRTVEIGVRMALGGRRSDILRLVMSDVTWTLAIGIGVGLALAWTLSSLASRLLFGLTPTDPLTSAAVVGLLLVSASLAAYVPTRRAMQVNPVVAFRSE